MSVLLNLPKVLFDFGAVINLPYELEILNVKRPFFITDRNLLECGVFEKAVIALPQEAKFPICDEIPENPTVEGVEKAYYLYAEKMCDGIVAVGGGSVIDSAKMVAFRSGHSAPISQYEHHPEMITDSIAPLITIPTTAGTGSEVTFGAGVHPDPQKPSMNFGSPNLIPDIAICDPELTMTLPESLTASTGMDAFGQCIEAYLARGNNPVIDAVVLDGAKRAYENIQKVVRDGDDKEARWNMMMAALEGGIGIHKGLGSAHSIANSLGDQGFNHGLLVTIALPAVLRFLENSIVERINSLRMHIGLEDKRDLALVVEQLNKCIGIPENLKDLGYQMKDIAGKAELCHRSIFNMTAPIIPSNDQYRKLLEDIS